MGGADREKNILRPISQFSEVAFPLVWDTNYAANSKNEHFLLVLF